MQDQNDFRAVSENVWEAIGRAVEMAQKIRSAEPVPPKPPATEVFTKDQATGWALVWGYFTGF